MLKSSNNMKAMMFMALNAISLAALYAVMKGITLAGVSSNQAAFLYKFVIFLVTLPWIFHKDGLNAIKTPNIKLHLIRAVFSSGGTLSMMYSLKYLKLMDVTALTHLEQMLWIVVGTVFFHERVTLLKVCAVVLAFLGGFVIVKPEAIHNIIAHEQVAAEFNKGYLFVFLTVGFWIVNSSLIKLLGHRKATNKAQLFYVMFFSSIFSYCVAFTDWRYYMIGDLFFIPYPADFHAALDPNIGLKQIGLLAIASLCYLIHSSAFFYGMKGDMTVIAPLVYLKLVCAGTFGYLIFGETPKLAISYCGYAMIITAGLLVLHSEYRLQRSKKLVLQGSELSEA